MLDGVSSGIMGWCDAGLMEGYGRLDVSMVSWTDVVRHRVCMVCLSPNLTCLKARGVGALVHGASSEFCQE